MEKNQNNKIRNENGEITADNKETNKIIRDYWEQLQVTKMDNIEEIGYILEKNNSPQLSEKEVGNLNRCMRIMKITAQIKNLSTIKRSQPDGFTDESCNFFFLIYQEVLWKNTVNQLKLFQKLQRMVSSPIHCMRPPSP